MDSTPCWQVSETLKLYIYMSGDFFSKYLQWLKLAMQHNVNITWIIFRCPRDCGQFLRDLKLQIQMPGIFLIFTAIEDLFTT